MGVTKVIAFLDQPSAAERRSKILSDLLKCSQEMAKDRKGEKGAI
jgi:hypothetical protein